MAIHQYKARFCLRLGHIKKKRTFKFLIRKIEKKRSYTLRNGDWRMQGGSNKSEKNSAIPKHSI